jgi:hypothetical protein
MKVLNGQIFQAREPLQKLSGEKLPVKASWGLAKLSLKLNEQLKAIDEVRNGLINKYGVADEKGNVSVKQDTPNWNKFVEEFNELMMQEVEIVFEKVKLPEKVSATCDACKHNMDKPLEIEPATLMALEPFIEL